MRHPQRGPRTGGMALGSMFRSRAAMRGVAVVLVALMGLGGLMFSTYGADLLGKPTPASINASGGGRGGNSTGTTLSRSRVRPVRHWRRVTSSSTTAAPGVPTTSSPTAVPDGPTTTGPVPTTTPSTDSSGNTVEAGSASTAGVPTTAPTASPGGNSTGTSAVTTVSTTRATTASTQQSTPTTQAATTTVRPTTAPTAAPATTAASGRTGCASSPSSCGYPDASNTGPSSGTTLRKVPGEVTKGTGWAWDSRGYVAVTGNGAVLENLDISGTVDVTASDVMIRNVRIVVGGESFGVALRHTSNVTIQDSEVRGPDAGSGRLMVAVKDIYGDAAGTQVLRTDISNASTGVQIYGGLVADSYIHDLGYRSGDHVNGTTDNGGSSRQLTLRHNTIFNPHDQTDAISLFQDFGTQTNRTIENNLVAGGGYTIYGGANPGKAVPTNIKILNNRFSRIYFPNGGSYGPVTAFNSSGAGNEFSGNVWDDTGAAVRL